MQRVQSRRHSERADVNLTPMVDIVYLLLVFFVVTTQPKDLMGMIPANSGSATCRYDAVLRRINWLRFIAIQNHGMRNS
jgi:hypothetical protein